MQWNASHAESYVNSTLCGSTESGYEVAGYTGWGSMDNSGAVDLSSSSNQSLEEVVDFLRNRDSLLVGAWRGAPDGVGVDQRGGYFTGLLDNLEVRCGRSMQVGGHYWRDLPTRHVGEEMRSWIWESYILLSYPTPNDTMVDVANPINFSMPQRQSYLSLPELRTFSQRFQVALIQIFS